MALEVSTDFIGAALLAIDARRGLKFRPKLPSGKRTRVNLEPPSISRVESAIISQRRSSCPH
jgi:hypothetical protein